MVRRTLEKRLSALEQEYTAVLSFMSRNVDPVSIERAKRQLKNIDEQMKEVGLTLDDMPADCPVSIAERTKQTVEMLRDLAPDAESWNRLSWFFTELNGIYHALKEWKELHYYLQECIIEVSILNDDLVCALKEPDGWDKDRWRLLWHASCEPRFRLLEDFASNIKIIDNPFVQDGSLLRGPRWMILIHNKVASLMLCLDEGGHGQLYNSTRELWSECYAALCRADRHMLEVISDIRSISEYVE